MREVESDRFDPPLCPMPYLRRVALSIHRACGGGVGHAQDGLLPVEVHHDVLLEP
jgi:hypothetical protein